MAWAQGIFTFRPGAADHIADVALIFKLHLFLGLAIFLDFPFTRPVHVLSVPLRHAVWPGYQIVRPRRSIPLPDSGRAARWCAGGRSAAASSRSDRRSPAGGGSDMSVPLHPDLVVNGETISHCVIAAEVQYHAAPRGKPGEAWRKATNAVAVRALLLQEARRRATAVDPAEFGAGRAVIPTRRPLSGAFWRPK